MHIKIANGQIVCAEDDGSPLPADQLELAQNIGASAARLHAAGGIAAVVGAIGVSPELGVEVTPGPDLTEAERAMRG